MAEEACHRGVSANRLWLSYLAKIAMIELWVATALAKST